MIIFGLPAGGFAIFGIMVALTQKLNKRFYAQKPQETMDREHYPGSISVRTDAIFETTEVIDGPRPSRTPARDAVPESLQEPGALAKQPETTSTPSESEEK